MPRLAGPIPAGPQSPARKCAVFAILRNSKAEPPWSGPFPVRFEFQPDRTRFAASARVGRTPTGAARTERDDDHVEEKGSCARYRCGDGWVPQFRQRFWPPGYDGGGYNDRSNDSQYSNQYNGPYDNGQYNNPYRRRYDNSPDQAAGTTTRSTMTMTATVTNATAMRMNAIAHVTMPIALRQRRVGTAMPYYRDCERQRSGNTAGGAIIGALAGGLLSEFRFRAGHSAAREPRSGRSSAALSAPVSARIWIARTAAMPSMRPITGLRRRVRRTNAL